jgi:hypothetical protein
MSTTVFPISEFKIAFGSSGTSTIFNGKTDVEKAMNSPIPTDGPNKFSRFDLM